MHRIENLIHHSPDILRNTHTHTHTHSHSLKSAFKGKRTVCYDYHYHNHYLSFSLALLAYGSFITYRYYSFTGSVYGISTRSYQATILDVPFRTQSITLTPASLLTTQGSGRWRGGEAFWDQRTCACLIAIITRVLLSLLYLQEKI